MLNHRAAECTPQRRGSAPHALAAACALGIAMASPAAARGDGPVRDPDLAEVADLDGSYLALGPRGSAVYGEGTWDGAFGAELFIYQYRADRAVSVLGLSAGGAHLSELDGGHAFAEVGAGGELARGLRVGLGLGLTTRLSPIRHPRWGGHATFWAHAGAIPYVRVGMLQDTGMFVDLGIRLALPALRW